MARKTAPTMAAMTRATPAQRAGETSGPCFFWLLRLELARADPRSAPRRVSAVVRLL